MRVREDYRTLSGPEKAAILLLSLPEDQTAKIFEQMDDEEIMELSQTMAGLGKVSPNVVERLFVDFAEQMTSTNSLIGTQDSTERLLAKAGLSGDRIENIMEEIRGPAGRTMWEKLGNVNEEILATFLQKEYPILHLPIAHVDLRFLARRVGLSGGQKAVEREIGIQRDDEIRGMTGESAPILWHRYRLGDVAAARNLISYNHADIEGIVRLDEFLGAGVPVGEGVGQGFLAQRLVIRHVGVGDDSLRRIVDLAMGGDSIEAVAHESVPPLHDETE